ncbi:MAG: hypothetical protein JXN60_00395, partial [Lentisphaerae bacterium]|nr:hypothetical protein [Lentisphaerota bacterium]
PFGHPSKEGNYVRILIQGICEIGERDRAGRDRPVPHRVIGIELVRQHRTINASQLINCVVRIIVDTVLGLSANDVLDLISGVATAHEIVLGCVVHNVAQYTRKRVICKPEHSGSAQEITASFLCPITPKSQPSTSKHVRQNSPNH